MLPSNLLLVYKRKGEIQPRYAKLTAENLKVATQLIEMYTTNVGAKKKVLTAFAGELENQGHDYRFIRALSLLLDRKSRFICNSKINPSDIRKKIFQATEKHGIPTTPKERQHILNIIASETSQTIETIEEQLYADLDAELLLEKFEAPTPIALLQQYNLSLTQTLLFECSELNFKVSGNWQQLLYWVKKLGLIYDVSPDDFSVKIDGPSSLFKLTKRYGINIAKLLPIIMANQTWTINAKILWKYTNEICNFEMDNTKHHSLLRMPNIQPVTYDSAAEESFANQFKAINSTWTLKREPEPVIAGNQVIIPDFLLEKSGLKIYLEIIGFWTEEYLRRKAEKLKQVNVKMILIVHETLACEKLTSLEKRPQLHFIYYKDKIPMAQILKHLHKEFEEIKTKEINNLKEMNIKFTEPILIYTEFAQQTGFSIEAIQNVLTTNPPTDYIPISNGLISKEKLQQIANTLNNTLQQTEKLTLSQATTIIENEGVNDATNILDHLGYKIKWHGINSDKAEIQPPKKQ
jgi:predicted nuclease of restriction endonuclease-like RecB superfamily